MENISEINNTLQSLSRDLANVVEQASTAVVAVNAFFTPCGAASFKKLS